jgi:hypothetical protein
VYFGQRTTKNTSEKKKRLYREKEVLVKFDISFERFVLSTTSKQAETNI